MKQLMIWGLCDCLFMAAFVAVAVLGTLAIGM